LDKSIGKDEKLTLGQKLQALLADENLAKLNYKISKNNPIYRSINV
jgi:hypothetical protein